jgi:hypothetical protein
MRLFAYAFAFAALLGVAGCGQPCDASHVCNLDTDGLLCDGSNFTACDDGTRGKTVGCPQLKKVAICSPTGWTFQDAP